MKATPHHDDQVLHLDPADFQPSLRRNISLSQAVVPSCFKTSAIVPVSQMCNIFYLCARFTFSTLHTCPEINHLNDLLVIYLFQFIVCVFDRAFLVILFLCILDVIKCSNVILNLNCDNYLMCHSLNHEVWYNTV